MIELDWLKRWNLYAPQSVALKDGETGREYTYRDLYQASHIGADLLKREFGVQSGDRIAILSTNELEYVALFFAAQRLGAILVPVNYRLTPREVEHIVRDCEPKLIVFQKEFGPLIQELSPDLRSQQLLLQGPDSFADRLRTRDFVDVGFQSSPDSPCMIIYTSGTTGAPKGAVLSQQMLFWNSVNTTLRLNLSQQDRTVIFLPFFHTGGWNVLTTPFFHRGAQIILLKKFEAEKILELCEKEQATILFGVPTTMDMMARSPRFSEISLKSLRYAIVGGEPMPVDLIRIWHEKGIAIRQGYGLTEFGPNVFSLNEQDAIRKIGSIGFPNFYIDAKAVDETGTPVGPREIGELVLRGPMAMTGYWRNPQATSETIVDGWLHTGDLVRQDEEGYFYVVGRKKDMYKSGGENVYPAELEQVLRSHPGVREVAVIGVPDEKWGEVGQAFVVKDDETLAIEHLQDHCVKNLAKFKIPKHFVFMPELPKGDSGKILKKTLRDLPATVRR